MSPFVVMALTGVGTGLLVPAIAIGAAQLGICCPFSLKIAGKKWTFGRTQKVVAGNTFSYVDFHMPAVGAFEQHGQSNTLIFKFSAA